MLRKRWWLGLLAVAALGLLALGATGRVFYTTILAFPPPPLAQGNPLVGGFVLPANSLSFEPLFVFIPGPGDTIPAGVLAGQSRMVPRLGISYEVTPEAFTVRLREGVTWFDGAPFTSRDVWTSLQIGYLLGGVIWHHLDRVETPDEYTVRFVWKVPTAFVKPLVAGLLISHPYHLFGEVAGKVDRTVRPGDEPNATLVRELRERVIAATEIIGTGPFIITDVTAAELLAKKNPNHYYADRIPVDGVRLIRAVTDEVHWGQMIAGELDFSTVFKPIHIIEAIKAAQPGAVMATGLPASEVVMTFDLRVYPYSALYFRRALIYALDRRQPLELAWYPYGFAAEKHVHGVFRPEEPAWLSPEFLATLETFEHNPAKAEEILVGAGWSRGPDGNWRDAEGRPVTLELTTVAEWPEWVIIADNIGHQLTEFGLPTEVWSVSETLFWAVDGLVAKMWLGLGTRQVPFRHPWNAFRWIYVTGRPPHGRPVGLAEAYPELVAEATSLLDQLAVALTLDEQVPIVEKLARLTNEHVANISFGQRLAVRGYFTHRLVGWPGAGDPIWILPVGPVNVFPLVQGLLRAR